MIHELHSIRIIEDRCKGRLACMRVCPTDAIRVRGGRVSIKPPLCIDCGNCIVACPEGAIVAITDPWEEMTRYKFKVAILSPVLFGQFPRSITPCDIYEGLLSMGFDAVHDLSLESELYFRAIQDYLEDYDGPLPLISSMCPVVVRLVQVAYPDMVGQVTPIQPPREIAGRETKKKYSKEQGISEDEIGAIYISPCPAKIASIKAPAEKVKSNLDMALGIRDIYNPLLAAITKNKKARDEDGAILPRTDIYSQLYISLPITGGLSKALQQKRYISVAQLPNITQVFEDIEKGKIRSIEFLECFSCTGGCTGGSLTVDDRFVARSKLQKVSELIGEALNGDEDKFIDQHYTKGEYYLYQTLEPRPVERNRLSIIEQIERVKIREEYQGKLPGIDCGLCGSPTCAIFANDVANGDSDPSDCMLLSPARVDELRIMYKIDDKTEDDQPTA